jgi:hypothetical protein
MVAVEEEHAVEEGEEVEADQEVEDTTQDPTKSVRDTLFLL